MADKNDKVPDTSTGRYYVDQTCIDCDLCRCTAPTFFSRNEELGFSIVYRQPSTPEEVLLAEEALDACPSGSIGSDGD
jgi:ferredoxin